jgi:Matrixin
VLVLARILPAFGCGGLTSSASSGAPNAVTVVAGDTGAPVAGAQVTIGGQSLTTSASGEVLLQGPGGVVRIDSAGFLQRETVLGGTSALSLWPVRASYSELYVESLIYRPSTSASALSPSGDHPLNRVTARRLSLAPTAALRADGEAMATLQRSIAVANDATAGQVVFGIDDPSAPVVFVVGVDDTARDGAFTLRRVRNDVIEGGSITFSRRPGFDPSHDVRYVAHELGHTLGLEHSIVPTDMMYFSVQADSPDFFTPNECLTIRLLLQRSPGNHYPDRDVRVS